jgi:hypothetical protein
VLKQILRDNALKSDLIIQCARLRRDRRDHRQTAEESRRGLAKTRAAASATHQKAR